ncbi:MAG: DUF2341 domain-containing protein [Phaeodactylibacter sp.]|nr:DUF2341 domain-containing protein [Phaeodactylibacter sp.]
MRIFLLLNLLLLSTFSFGQDCLPGWDFYRDITIDNSAGGNQTDFQVRLVVNTGFLVGEGKLKADGSDLRFTDTDCNLISYFMDSSATNTNNVIWVKLPSIPAGGSVTIRAYYGNPDAEPAASGDDTFVFFDDFESGEVDLSKWEPVGGYATLAIVDGILRYASDGMNPGPRFKFVRTAMSFSEPMIFDFAAEISNSNGFGFSSADVDIDRILFRQSVFGFDTLNQVALMQDTLSNGFQVEGMFPFIRYPRNVMQDATILAGINNSNHLQINDFENLSINSASASTYELISPEMTGFHFILSSFLSAHTIYLDYLRVRKPAANPPTGTIGDEVGNISSTKELAGQGYFELFPNPAKGQVTLENHWTDKVAVQVYDALGQGVLRQDLQPGAATLSLSGLAKGLYTMAIRTLDTGDLIYVDQLIIAE